MKKNMQAVRHPAIRNMLTTNPTITALLDWLVVSAGSLVGMTVFEVAEGHEHPDL